MQSGPLIDSDLPVGVLLAAGFGRRFDATGARNKLLAPLEDGRSVAWHSARTLATALPGALAIVRPDQQALSEQLREAGCHVIATARAEAGMGAALAAAVEQTPGARGWVVALADMPWVPLELVRAVALSIVTPEAIAAPWRDGRRGHPVGFGAAWRDALQRLDGDQGARALLETRTVTRILTDDDGAFRDIDTHADLPGSSAGPA
ncbi:NTP transferase domain-containing protein [Cupriavidus sp. AU9028]|uniref:nucleotidyltransferase family protein n=1 Tax=Cupriavidus sp. AU9028 TaxID=2871157 RepID=UPI001C9539F3|nr:NTP transferase domain-containing protein [Cupriavidus sp. AU9028]MBY4896493.1 NTP transferase domain-containing protein [Cupriavidus sp. AU9028]